MSDIITILNDVIKVLDSVVLLEAPIKELALEGKNFAQAFKSGDVKKTQASCDALYKVIGEVEEIFKDYTIEPVMDLYKQISQLMHLHISQGEKQLQEIEKALNLKTAKQILESYENHQQERS